MAKHLRDCRNAGADVRKQALEQSAAIGESQLTPIKLTSTVNIVGIISAQLTHQLLALVCIRCGWPSRGVDTSLQELSVSSQDQL